MFGLSELSLHQPQPMVLGTNSSHGRGGSLPVRSFAASSNIITTSKVRPGIPSNIFVAATEALDQLYGVLSRHALGNH